MKKIIVTLLCVSSLVNANYLALSDKKTYLKDYGLSYCLWENLPIRNKSFEELSKVFSIRGDISRFMQASRYYLKMSGFKKIEEITQIIDSYVLEYISKPENQRAPNKQEYRVHMLECMQMYHSKEYDQVIDKIFNNKKYYDAKKLQKEKERFMREFCKDCK